MKYLLTNPALQKRSRWLMLAAFALAMEAFALVNQHVWGLLPCNECIYIRAGVLGIALAALLGATAPKLAAIRLSAFALFWTAMAWALWHAMTLVDIERKVAGGAEVGCKRFHGFPSWMPLEKLVPEMFEPRGKCGEIVGTFLGQSFAVWSLVGLAYLAFMVVAVVSISGCKTPHGPKYPPN